MGRPRMRKNDKKQTISICLPKMLLDRIDEIRWGNRSDFICEFLKTNLFNDVSYCNYEIRQAKLKLAYWEYEYAVCSAKRNNKKLRLMEYDKKDKY